MTQHAGGHPSESPPSMDLAEIDDAEAAATARIIAKVKRIVYEDVIWDQIILES